MVTQNCKNMGDNKKQKIIRMMSLKGNSSQMATRYQTKVKCMNECHKQDNSV